MDAHVWVWCLFIQLSKLISPTRFRYKFSFKSIDWELIISVEKRPVTCKGFLLYGQAFPIIPCQQKDSKRAPLRTATLYFENQIFPKLFKFLNQCFARLQCWKKCLEFTKPTCWINSCFAGDTFLRPKLCKTLI